MTVMRQPIVLEGQTIVATMAVDYGSLCLSSISLVRRERDGLMRIWVMPNSRNRVVITDKAERDQLLQAALDSFRALTGRDPAELPLAKAPLELEPSHDPS
jgi:hypothetical protein